MPGGFDEGVHGGVDGLSMGRLLLAKENGEGVIGFCFPVSFGFRLLSGVSESTAASWGGGDCGYLWRGYVSLRV